MKGILNNSSHFCQLVFSRGWGFCLDDIPKKKGLKSKVIAPGVIYDVHHQCQLQYGPNATFCQEVEVSVDYLSTSWVYAGLQISSMLKEGPGQYLEIWTSRYRNRSFIFKSRCVCKAKQLSWSHTPWHRHLGILRSLHSVANGWWLRLFHSDFQDSQWFTPVDSIATNLIPKIAPFLEFHIWLKCTSSSQGRNRISSPIHCSCLFSTSK